MYDVSKSPCQSQYCLQYLVVVKAGRQYAECQSTGSKDAAGIDVCLSLKPSK